MKIVQFFLEIFPTKHIPIGDNSNVSFMQSWINW